MKLIATVALCVVASAGTQAQSGTDTKVEAPKDCYRCLEIGKDAFAKDAGKNYQSIITLLEGRAKKFEWQSPHFADAPQAGTIFDGSGQPSSLLEITKRIETAKYVLLGETHNNRDHHIIQAHLLSFVASMERTPVVVFEMVAEPLQPVLDKARAVSDLDGLDSRLKWDKTGWPPFADYEPVFRHALEAGLSLKAGNLPRKELRKLARNGGKKLKKKQRKAWGLDVPLSDDQKASLLSDLKLGHCNMMPEEALGPMLVVQRVRDGLMARAMIDAGEKGAVLIAGSGHVRNDRGVPWVLSKMEPDSKSVSIGLIELASTDPLDADAIVKQAGGKGLFDFIVLTPRAEIKDHCAELREKFAKKKPAGSEVDNAGRSTTGGKQKKQ